MRNWMFVFGAVCLSASGCFVGRTASPGFVDADITTVSPQAVCGAQPITFASDLDRAQQTPTVRLDLRVRNDGSPGPKLAFQLPDESDGPVQWSPSGLLRFELSRQLDFGGTGSMLPFGLYDVVAERGDARRIAAPRGLAVVPPPRLHGAVSGRCLDGSAGCIALRGAGFLLMNDALPSVSFVPDGGGRPVVVLAESASECLPLAAPEGMMLSSCARLSVAKAALAPGGYHVTVKNPSHTGCVSAEPVRLTLGAASQSPPC